MNTQPKSRSDVEALRLADLLEQIDGWHYPMGTPQELRRLHALNQSLAESNVELLEALKGLLADITEYQTINNLGGENNHWQVIARAAIAKASGLATKTGENT